MPTGLGTHLVVLSTIRTASAPSGLELSASNSNEALPRTDKSCPAIGSRGFGSRRREFATADCRKARHCET